MGGSLFLLTRNQTTSLYSLFAEMGSPRLILLSCFLIQCYGSTHFHYLKKGEELTLSCETCQWEADVDSDNIVDCNIIGSIYTTTSKCPTRRQNICQEMKKNKSTSCEIRVMRGFFACVNATSDSCFKYPFKPSSNHVESFIVTQAEPGIVSGPVMENSVLVSGGESINLTCAFKTKGSYSNKPFVVYWIKTGAQSSTCVYSFDYGAGYDSGFDDHCAIDKDLLLRRSNTSRPSLDDNNHNLKISKATHSDRGQYLCVLMVNTYSHQYWAVITSTTVIVDSPDKTQEKSNATGNTTADSHPTMKVGVLVGVLVPVLLLLPVIIIILLKRKSAETKVSQTAITQRFQNGEEVDDDDCSPYAMGQGEQEPTYSFIQLTNQKTDPVFSGDGELASDPSADEGIMRKNSIYETSGP